MSDAVERPEGESSNPRVDRRPVRGGQTGFLNSRSALKWGWLVLPVGFLWFRLINNLRVEWETNPQYSFGYVVPLLCIGLLLRRWQSLPQGSVISHQSSVIGHQSSVIGHQSSVIGHQSSVIGHPSSGNPQSGLLPPSSGLTSDLRPLTSGPSSDSSADLRPLSSVLCPLSIVFALLALLYLPTRLVEGATPEWRPIQWSLGVVTIGLTLGGIYATKGRQWLREFAFPILFLFVAIPWPTIVEGPIIQNLTQANSAAVVEIMGILGVPALQHGNVIEVASGVVGIDEACSGIRSFQSSLMISLFLGELYRLGLWRRVVLVPVGFLVAFLFNICRTTFLTWVAAKKGVAAIAVYHDQAGLTILVACIATMWVLTRLMVRSRTAQESEDRGQRTEDGGQRAEVRCSVVCSPVVCSPAGGSPVVRSPLALQRLRGWSLALLVWIISVEAGVEGWYRLRESKMALGPNWTVQFPTNFPSYRSLPIAPATESLLRFDSGKQGAWREANGTEWMGFYFEWLPGRVAGYLAKRHTPEICLPAAGRKLTSGPELVVMKIRGVELPMRVYLFNDPDGPLHVFQCRWEAGAGREAYIAEESARYNLVRAVWAGRGKRGQKVLEFIVKGIADPAIARAAVVQQLEKVVKVEGVAH